MDFCALSFYCTTLNSGCLRSQSYSKIIRFPTPVFGLLLCSLSECGWSIQLILQITFASGSVLLMQLIHNINFNHLLVSGHTVDAAWGLWGSGTNQSVSHWPPSHLPTILSPRRGAHIFRKERDKSQAPGLLSQSTEETEEKKVGKGGGDDEEDFAFLFPSSICIFSILLFLPLLKFSSPSRSISLRAEMVLKMKKIQFADK